MRSLATSAVGHPKETMPMVGGPSRRVSGTKERARSGRRFGGFWDMAAPISESARGVKGGRHIRAAEDTPAANLLLGVLQKLDVPLESFADSTGAVEI